jgi:8-oxo-dGTP pyrophosphatase MutT (NUDIX family)
MQLSTPQNPQDWIRPLRQAMQQPPAAPRWPLHCNGQPIGTVEQGLLESMAAPAWAAAQGLQLLAPLPPQGAGGCWQLQATDPTQALNGLAQLLRSHGCCGPWRNEQLDVRADGSDTVLATIERGAVRALGIATQAVHLLGLAPDGRMWVQQRALDKASHPGKWDTLMGGMVSSGDSVATALARETQEEAGLDVTALQACSYGGHVDFACPNSEEGDGLGYMRERIHWYQAQLPQGLEPQNQDGEVAQFQCIDRATLEAWLLAGRFTPEASLILADYLAW